MTRDQVIIFALLRYLENGDRDLVLITIARMLAYGDARRHALTALLLEECERTTPGLKFQKRKG